MKAILQYNLPDDKENFDCAVKGIDYRIALSDVSDYLRNLYKHVDLEKEFDNSLYNAVEKIRDRFHEILGEYNIEL